jgi:hypothetical protein
MLKRDLVREYNLHEGLISRAKDEIRADRSGDANHLPKEPWEEDEGQGCRFLQGFDAKPMEFRMRTLLRPGLALYQCIPVFPRYTSLSGVQWYSAPVQHFFWDQELITKQDDDDTPLDIDKVPLETGVYSGEYHEDEEWKGIDWPILGVYVKVIDNDKHEILVQRDWLQEFPVPSVPLLMECTPLPKVVSELVVGLCAYDYRPRYHLVQRENIKNRLRKRRPADGESSTKRQRT